MLFYGYDGPLQRSPGTGSDPGTPPPGPQPGGTVSTGPGPGPYQLGGGTPPPQAAPQFVNPTPSYSGPSAPGLPTVQVPQFNAPTFSAPTGASEQNDPGYQFRLAQGEQALQNSAAARGVLNTGGTLKDVLGYGQNYASQEYANVFNRALQNYANQYQLAKDKYAPLYGQYQNVFGAQNAADLAAFQRAWDQYTFGINDEFRREQMLMGSQGPTS